MIARRPIKSEGRVTFSCFISAWAGERTECARNANRRESEIRCRYNRFAEKGMGEGCLA